MDSKHHKCNGTNLFRFPRIKLGKGAGCIIMPTRFEQAIFRVNASKQRFKELRELSARYLQNQTDATLLQVQESTTEILEKLRSALDYCAAELYDRCNSAPSPATLKVYFPIAARRARQTDFRSVVGSKIPGLLQSRPDLFALLSSYQEFSDPSNSWLPDIATLANESKHDQFSQNRVAHGGISLLDVRCTGVDRVECRQLRIDRGGRFILGCGIELHADGITIRGPRTILGGPPYLDPPGTDGPKLQAFAYLDLKFRLNDWPVQVFLWEAIQGTERIVLELAVRA